MARRKTVKKNDSKEKRVVVIDHTGENKHCNRCKEPDPNATARGGQWLCAHCAVTAFIDECAQEKHESVTRHKLKKARRTLKQYILDRFLEGGMLSVELLAEEAIEECLTKTEDVDAAKVVVSSTISALRKESQPIDRVGRGVYQWRRR